MAIHRCCLGPSGMTRSSTTMLPTKVTETKMRKMISPNLTRKQDIERSRSRKGKLVCRSPCCVWTALLICLFTGIMKKVILLPSLHSLRQAYELSTLTGIQVLLPLVSETGLVYTFTTAKHQPLVTQPEGKISSKPVSMPPTAPFLPLYPLVRPSVVLAQ